VRCGLFGCILLNKSVLNIKDWKTMNEELALLKDIARRLEDAGIEYMMTGSMALAFYSTPRMTRDIDIILQVSYADVGKIVALFKKDFYIEENSVRQAVRDQSMFNIIHHESVLKVDFIIRKDEEYRKEEFLRKRKITIEGSQVSIVSPEDLVLSKLVWAKTSQSALQLRDVKQMMLNVKQIDHEYLTKWSKTLGVEELLTSVRKYE
jgi:Nucleotidyl transferase of unknown function (DUF2204)